MLLLAADTTTANGSVALAQGDQVVGELRLPVRENHSSTLLPAIESLLRSSGRGPRDIDVWAVAVGPGAFTGLRVGISTIQGLALASSRPCVGVSALHALAAGAVGRAAHVVALMDAFRNEVYAQVFDAAAQPLASPAVGRLQALLASLPAEAAFVGDAVPAWRTEIARLLPRAVFPVRSPFLATEVARLAVREAAAGRVLDADALRPLYLRAPDIRAPRA
jgi:tRNA threonylcarbamoyladenosine biosynthesis protein TsaB